MAAVVLFRGVEHVMEWTDSQSLHLSPRDGRGAPVKEMFPEDVYEPIQVAMDEAYHSGHRVRIPYVGGWFIADPRRDASGLVFGVATVWVASQQLAVAPPEQSPDRQSDPAHLEEAEAAR
jgi:hypothetical protein